MPTGTKKGLNPARKVGSAPDNKGLNTYSIASGYGTTIGLDDPVKLVAGLLERATNDTADSIGVFAGVSYTDVQGAPVFSKIWPASTVASDIVALVLDDPMATFQGVANADISAVVRGEIYAMTTTDADTFTGQSTMEIDVAAGAVASTAGLVKVISIVDVDNRVLECVLVDHDLRDDA